VDADAEQNVEFAPEDSPIVQAAVAAFKEPSEMPMT
jgi:hypothetical protein